MTRRLRHPGSLMNAGLAAFMLALPAIGSAQQAASPEQESGSMTCDADSCRNGDGLLFRLRTRSWDEPVTRGTNELSSSAALQPDRRAVIELPAPEAPAEPGRAVVGGRFSIDLPDGGTIWATEDPALGDAELSVSAPSLVAFDGTRIVQPVQFYARTNYSAFIARYELRLYRASDVDLVEPLATVPLKVANVSRADWSGELVSSYPLRTGDTLIYVLRAYDADGNVDETLPATLQLATPEETERGSELLREEIQRALGVTLSLEEAGQQYLIDEVFARNGLRLHNIPIRGSRIRIQGRNIPPGFALRIDGDDYPVDLERKFVAEYLLPIGTHSFDIALVPAGVGGAAAGEELVRHHTLDVAVSGHYAFGVGLADLTLYQNKASGPGRELAENGRDDDVLGDGRLAYYGKYKFDGRYLLTMQADTTARELGHLFDGFADARAEDLFRNLDPDLYYPTYGDDSTSWRDVDTQGRFYARLDWEKNQALWGNYSTAIAGTEFAQYQRSLYGAGLWWRSLGANPWGEAKSQLRLFGSQAQSAPGHDEFLGTGGSLYYLRQANVLAGSDVARIEVRDLTTGRLASTIALTRGADYEIDATQGRILLTRPLLQITREAVPGITRASPLDGFEERLVVDYEWIPTGFDTDGLSGGVRAKQWLGDHVAVGGTYVDQNQAGADYTLKGADLTLQAGRGTWLRMEYAHSDSLGVPVNFSDNGGFSFSQVGAVAVDSGASRVVEGRANFKEQGWTRRDWSADAWWRDVDAGFASSSYSLAYDTTEYGGELLGNITDDLATYLRVSRAERGSDALTQVQGQLEWRLTAADMLDAEVRRIEEDQASLDAIGVLGALKYTHRFNSLLETYGLAQVTLDDDHGAYADNDALVLGGNYLFGERSSVGAEVSHGDRGDTATLQAEYRFRPEQTLYGSYTRSTDRTEYESLFAPVHQSGWTVGQRWQVSNRANLFNESQYLKPQDTGNEAGFMHTFGMDFFPALGWNYGFTLGYGDLTNVTDEHVDRKAVSLAGGYTAARGTWQSKLEWREDSGAERRTQWVGVNRVELKLDESWRVAARLNWADTVDHVDESASAKFIEANLGFAWRPWYAERWAVFGRYTYLYDLATLGQLGAAQYDQKTHVVSLEGVYRLDRHWETAGRVARRLGEARTGRGEGPWFDSAATFAAWQVRYELPWKLHALAEDRWLRVGDGGGTRRGFLIGADRDVAKNLRLGVGYNFTDFSDDLTDFSYRHRGWYLNLVGSY